MEFDKDIIVPRATKCGCHTFCYACLLQYLDFYQDVAWEKCPTCKVSIYRKDIRRATLLFEEPKEQDSPDKLRKKDSIDVPGQMMEFRLMVRNKSNINVKYKDDTDSMTIIESQLASVNSPAYGRSRIRVSDESYLRNALQQDLVALNKDLAESKSCAAYEKVPYLEEAIMYCEELLEAKEGRL